MANKIHRMNELRYSTDDIILFFTFTFVQISMKNITNTAHKRGISQLLIGFTYLQFPSYSPAS